MRKYHYEICYALISKKYKGSVSTEDMHFNIDLTEEVPNKRLKEFVINELIGKHYATSIVDFYEQYSFNFFDVTLIETGRYELVEHNGVAYIVDTDYPYGNYVMKSAGEESDMSYQMIKDQMKKAVELLNNEAQSSD